MKYLSIENNQNICIYWDESQIWVINGSLEENLGRSHTFFIYMTFLKSQSCSDREAFLLHYRCWGAVSPKQKGEHKSILICGCPWRPEESTRSPGLEIQISHHIGAGNQSLVFWQSSQCSSLMSHLSRQWELEIGKNGEKFCMAVQRILQVYCEPCRNPMHFSYW